MLTHRDCMYCGKAFEFVNASVILCPSCRGIKGPQPLMPEPTIQPPMPPRRGTFFGIALSIGIVSLLAVIVFFGFQRNWWNRRLAPEVAKPFAETSVQRPQRSVPKVPSGTVPPKVRSEVSNKPPVVAVLPQTTKESPTAGSADSIAAIERYSKDATDPDPKVHIPALNQLVLKLRHPEASVRQSAAEKIFALGESALSILPALQAIESDLQSTVRDYVRRSIITLQAAVKRMEDQKAVAFAAEMELKSQRERDRKAKIDELARELQAKDPERRIKALMKLAEFGPEACSARDELTASLLDDEVAIRKTALDALTKISPKCQPYLRILVEKAPPEAKLAAMKSLGELGSDAVVSIPLLLKYNDKPSLWGGGKKGHLSLFPVIAAIDGNDPRFAEFVIAFVSAPPNGTASIRERRLAGLAYLDTVKVKKEVKITALAAALADPETVLKVIPMLQAYGHDAAPALPQLRKLKASNSAAIRTAALTAIAQIE